MSIISSLLSPIKPHNNIDLAAWTRKDLTKARRTTFTWAGIAGIGEILTGHAVFLILLSSGWQSWSLAVIAVLVANGLAYWAAGLAYRSKVLAAAAIIGGWLFVGATLVFARVMGGRFVPSGVNTDTSAEELIAMQASDEQKALIVAVVLAGLYIAGGLLIFLHAYSHSHPALAPHIDWIEKENAAAAAAVKALGDYSAANQHVALRRAEIDASPAELEARHQSIRASFALAKEQARVHIAELLGDPRATGGTETPFAPPRAQDPAGDPEIDTDKDKE